MAKFTCTRIKKSAVKKATAPGAKAAGTAFVLVDNQDDTVTVMGVDAGGNAVDISAVATLTAVSSDPTILATDPPAGMTYKEHALKPGHADVTITATWNDASIGPFGITDPVDVTTGGPTGLVATHGTPVAR